MATIFTLCALFVLLIVMIAFCLGYRRKIPILRETLTTAEQAQDTQLFSLLSPYQPDDYTPSEYEQHQTDINMSYCPQTIEVKVRVNSPV